MSEFKIEKNVPFVDAQKDKYPLKDMAVMDSFFIKTDATTEKKLKQNVLAAVSNFKSKEENKAKRFSTRKLEGGIRVWRIA